MAPRLHSRRSLSPTTDDSEFESDEDERLERSTSIRSTSPPGSPSQAASEVQDDDIERTASIRPTSHTNLLSPAASEAPSDQVEQTAKTTSIQPTNPREHDLTSPIYTLLVGPSALKFTAHASILSRSPKFAAQCHSEHFLESSTKEINLPDDDPAIFALVLEYLYRDDYWPSFSELDQYQSLDEEVRDVELQREADLYCMAGYCQLSKLQEMVVQKLKVLDFSPMTSGEFFPISKYVYENNKGEGPYREYFREKMRVCMHLVEVKPWVVEQIDEGGELAVDLFLVSEEMREVEEGEGGENHEM